MVCQISSNLEVVWCARFVLQVLITISVKKPAFLNSDSVCYDLNESSPIVFEQNHLYSSIWQYKQERGLFVSQSRHVARMQNLGGGSTVLGGGQLST